MVALELGRFAAKPVGQPKKSAKEKAAIDCLAEVRSVDGREPKPAFWPGGSYAETIERRICHACTLWVGSSVLETG